MTILKVQRLSDADPRRFSNRETIDPKVALTVRSIFEAIKARGLFAVLEYTRQFDGVDFTCVNDLTVSDDEIKAAYLQLKEGELDTIRDTITRVSNFCMAQKSCIQDTKLETSEGSTELNWLPIERIGIYVPSGRAPLPVCAIMAAIPAKVAGVESISLCAPPRKDGSMNPMIIVAANECGIRLLYKIGGAQAIAAMTYGVGIPKVDMICGPGNAYVACAKQLAAFEGLIKIDTIAGPSEVLIIADETADPKLIASDMLAQAEHGPTSAAICVSISEKFANTLQAELDRQVRELGITNPADPLLRSLADFGAIYVADNLDELIAFANKFAIEHLELYLADSENVAARIPNAGAIFIKTGVVFGDYGKAGGNNILPTAASARFGSPLCVYSFLKQQQIERLTSEAQAYLAGPTALFAGLETLEAHSRSAEVRSRTKSDDTKKEGSI